MAFPNIQCDCGLTAGCPRCNPALHPITPATAPVDPDYHNMVIELWKRQNARIQELEAQQNELLEALEPFAHLPDYNAGAELAAKPIIALNIIRDAKQVWDKHKGERDG